MATALIGNPTLEQALARIRIAAAATATAQADDYPKASLDAEETRERFSGTDIYPPPFARNVEWRGNITPGLTWNIDFWGRQAAIIAQASDRQKAEQLDLAAARLALTTSVAQAYADLDHAYALIDIATGTLKQRQGILGITRKLVAAGLDSDIALRQAAGRVAQSKVDLEQAENQRQLAIHEIAVLTGKGATQYASISRPTLNVSAALPLPTELPADLLARRPDILASHLRIDAALSGRQAAKAAFYPDISLSAFAGLSSIGLNDLFRYASFDYGVGPTIHLPLFDAGRLKAQYRDASAKIDEAVADYNDTVLRAVQETADGLTQIDSLRQEQQDETTACADAQSAYDLAVLRYHAGLTDYLVVLTAENALLTAKRNVADITTAQFANRVRLLVAVGGSFNPARDEVTQTAATSQEIQP